MFCCFIYAVLTSLILFTHFLVSKCLWAIPVVQIFCYWCLINLTFLCKIHELRPDNLEHICEINMSTSVLAQINLEPRGRSVIK